MYFQSHFLDASQDMNEIGCFGWLDVTFLLTFTGDERLSQKPTAVHCKRCHQRILRCKYKRQRSLLCQCKCCQTSGSIADTCNFHCNCLQVRFHLMCKCKCCQTSGWIAKFQGGHVQWKFPLQLPSNKKVFGTKKKQIWAKKCFLGPGPIVVLEILKIC